MYNIHFILSLFLATFLSFFFCQGKKKRFLSVFITPIVFFVLFFNYDYGLSLGGIAPIIISYFGAIYSSILIAFFTPQHINSYTNERYLNYSDKKKVKRICLSVFTFLFQPVLILYIYSIPWAIDTFPLSNIEAVLFTLFAGTNEGAEEFVLSSFESSVCIPATKIFTVVLVLQLGTAIVLKKRKLTFHFTFGKIKAQILGRTIKEYLGQIQKITTLAVVVYSAILSLILPEIVMSAPFKALFQQPVNSELYRNHYIESSSEQIRIIEKPKNLIVILLESMETNFSGHTPEIALLEHQSINFTPGGVSVAGTSWTIAAITAKLCGIPLNMPMKINEYLGKLPTYLPGASCLTDLLEEKKYNQVFIQGSSGNFTQIREFVKSHGHIVLYDLEHYKERGKVPNDYNVFWGIEDRKLYQYAKEELDSLYALDAPFALYLTTMDTHQPDGYVDDKCNKEFENIEKKYVKALRCASSQLYDFILWAETQPWFENTLISVMGDHTQPRLSAKAGVPKTDSLYWTNFMINSAIQKPIKTRQYTSLDMYPTLLEAMGFELEHRGIALGRSLFSDSLTMLELYGRKTLDSLLRERSIQYDKFLFGK